MRRGFWVGGTVVDPMLSLVVFILRLLRISVLCGSSYSVELGYSYLLLGKRIAPTVP